MAKKNTSHSDRRPKPRIIITGLALVFLGILVVSRTFPSLRSRYAISNGEVNAQAFENSSQTSDQKVATRIIIPAVGIDLAVKPAKIIAGYWQVFGDSAAWGEESGYPGKPGNQVIFAHARKGLFLPLKEVTLGTKVYVMTEGEWYTYEVKEITAVYPNQKEVIAPTADETLTLYTCTGYEDSKRLIVIAKRV